MNSVKIQIKDWVDPSSYTTPDKLWKPLDDEFHFTMDVAASAANAKCSEYITEEQDSLKTPWSGICWLNPPFRKLKLWAEKVVTEQARGITTVVLMPIVTSGWFHELVIPNAEIRFVRGNPKFGGSKTGMMWPLCVCIFKAK
jgi:phage N-6-adenine-methyltransferase